MGKENNKKNKRNQMKEANISNLTACSRLPETWNQVMTDTEFPVDTGTTITVSCQKGYINTGSKIVTCNTYLYQDFQYDREPNCNATVGKNG